MPWIDVQRRIVERFSRTLSIEKVRAIVEFFDRRKQPGGRGIEELSARPYVGTSLRGPVKSEIIERAAVLIPAMLAMVNLQRPMDLMRFVNGVIYSAVLTESYARARRKRPSSKQMVAGISKFRALASRYRELFDKDYTLRRAVSEIEYDLHMATGSSDFWLVSEVPNFLSILDVISDIIDHDIKLGGEAGRYYYQHETSAKPKLNSVEKAAYLCQRFNGPEIVTTPGSDYSLFASLLHEVGTGRRDESMLGAIIRFRRGELPSLTAISVPEDESDDIDQSDDWGRRYHLHRSDVARLVADKHRSVPVVQSPLLKLQLWHLEEAVRIREGQRRRRAANSRKGG